MKTITTEFLADVGRALNADRETEDAFRREGNMDAANAIYLRNKTTVRAMLVDAGITPKEFDEALTLLARKHRVHLPNVRLAKLFPDKKEVRRG
jgi:hypothetical protein